jgi:hypothetical protein
MKTHNSDRRLILKGIGALGASGLVGGLRGGSSGGASSSSSSSTKGLARNLFRIDSYHSADH